MTLNLQKMHSQAATKTRIPEGSHTARFAQIIDVGVQPQTDYQTNKPTDSKPMILITWELPNETIEVTREDGTTEHLPRWISKEVKQSTHEKATLQKYIETFTSGAAEASELAGLPCMLGVGSTNTGNAKVVSCMKHPVGMEIPDLANAPVVFDFDDPSEETFIKFPGWIQMKIMNAENYTGFADTWVDGPDEAA